MWKVSWPIVCHIYSASFLIIVESQQMNNPLYKRACSIFFIQFGFIDGFFCGANVLLRHLWGTVDCWYLTGWVCRPRTCPSIGPRVSHTGSEGRHCRGRNRCGSNPAMRIWRLKWGRFNLIWFQRFQFTNPVLANFVLGHEMELFRIELCTWCPLGSVWQMSAVNSLRRKWASTWGPTHTSSE